MEPRHLLLDFAEATVLHCAPDGSRPLRRPLIPDNGRLVGHYPLCSAPLVVNEAYDLAGLSVLVTWN